MAYAIDRIENGKAVCECLETGESIMVDIEELPKEVKEGDIIDYDGENYTIDDCTTKQHLYALTDRLNELLNKNR